MSTFLQITAGVLLTAVLTIVLNKQNKDISLVLSIAVCCMAILAAMRLLEPVFAFLSRLQQLGNLDENMLKIILKAVGIGIIAQISSLICTDSGNAALAKAIQILASAVILVQSMPLLESLMDLIQKIMGEL